MTFSVETTPCVVDVDSTSQQRRVPSGPAAKADIRSQKQTSYIVASELKDPIWHSLEWQIGSFSSEATIYAPSKLTPLWYRSGQKSGSISSRPTQLPSLCTCCAVGFCCLFHGKGKNTTLEQCANVPPTHCYILRSFLYFFGVSSQNCLLRCQRKRQDLKKIYNLPIHLFKVFLFLWNKIKYILCN